MLWCESVGGERKGMVFGQGSLYDKTENVLNPPVLGPPPPPPNSSPIPRISPLAGGTSSMAHHSSTPALGYSPSARGMSPQHRRSSTPTPGFTASASAPCPPPSSFQPHLTSHQFLHDRASSTTEIQREEIQREEAIIKARYQELKAYEESLQRRKMQMSETINPSTAPTDLHFQSLLIDEDSDLCALTDDPVGHTSYPSGMASFSSQLRQFQGSDHHSLLSSRSSHGY